MVLPIEDYALIGDCQTAALVGRDGSIDWLCLPRFDSGACFAALLGTPENGHWRIRPAEPLTRVTRRYRDETLILETTFHTAHGEACLVDCMPIRTETPELVRVVYGRKGTVTMEMQLVLRFDHGSLVPWVRRTPDGMVAIAGPDLVHLYTPAELHGEDFHTVARFLVTEGQTIPFVLTWQPSHKELPGPMEATEAIHETETWWRAWSSRCSYRGVHADLVKRSLITLKALTYSPTGGIVAAPTMGLPEELGGVRNWDYRFCWLRDATFTLYALLGAGYTDEARAWREWLLRAVAGKPSQMHIMYGIAGERRLTETTLDWLEGYGGSKPVRCGNLAYTQFQLDVYGEVMDVLQTARHAGLKPFDSGWRVQGALMEFLEEVWHLPDEGIWEIRGPRRQFTHSKVMAWVAADRAVKAVECFCREGPVERWRQMRATIHRQVCEQGFNPSLNSFVQAYGSTHLDASLLLIPMVGFLPVTDPRVVGTVEAIQRHLMRDGFVRRYDPDTGVDGLPGGEGAFLACTFWLVDNLALMGRMDEANLLFERVAALCNDVGLLSEEYDPVKRRFLGNFPQAFSHVALVNSAINLFEHRGVATERGHH